MAGFMYTSTLLRRIVPLGICPNGTILYPIWRQFFGVALYELDAELREIML